MSSMTTFETHSNLEAWLKTRARIQSQNLSVGFVPTMGALHRGHLSLLEKARAENDIAVLSIFVNPTQFDNPEDLKKYPLRLENDLKLAKDAGCHHVLLPTPEEMYADGYKYRMSEADFSKKLCGAHRPGHFDGVLTVVLKLFGLVQPQRAYFGQKDFQQLELIRSMASAFFLKLEVIGLPTVRETDGLAMSSRNLRLNPAERERAPLFPRTLLSSLQQNQTAAQAAQALTRLGFTVDYVEDHELGPPVELRRFGAVHLGAVRLIDNVTQEEKL